MLLWYPLSMKYSERDLEHARFVEEPMTPENVLGLHHNANSEQLEAAYAQRKQSLLEEVQSGQSGNGGRIVPPQEYETRLAEIEEAYQTLKQLALDEAEIDTQELDPDFPKRIQQQ